MLHLTSRGHAELVMEEISLLNSGIYVAHVHVKYGLTIRNFLVTCEQMFWQIDQE